MTPRKSVVACDTNLLNVGDALDADMLKRGTKASSKSVAPAHRRLTWKEKDNILGHETKNLRQVSGCGGAHPSGDNFSNLLRFVGFIHRVSLEKPNETKITCG